MSEMLQLSVKMREAKGKGANRRLRESKMVPGVFYNGKGENFCVQAEYIPLEKTYEKVGSNQVFQLKVEGHDVYPSLLWKVQRDPVKGFLEHVDFYGVDMSHKMRIVVPIELIGEPAGVKSGDGLLEVFRDSIEIECLPSDIPEKITIDVSKLGVGDNVHVQDLTVPEGVEVIFEEHFSVVGVVAQTSMEDTLAAEAAAEQAAALNEEAAGEEG